MLREAGFVELLDDHGIDVRRRRQIEQPVAVELVSAVELIQATLQLLKRFWMMIFPGYISQGICEFFAQVVFGRAGIREFLYGIDRRLLVRLVRHRRSCESDDSESPRQTILGCQAVQGRDKLSARKIARCAEDYDGARVRGTDRTLFSRRNFFGGALIAWRHFEVLYFAAVLIACPP